jgi:hypothetical protein
MVDSLEVGEHRSFRKWYECLSPGDLHPWQPKSKAIPLEGNGLSSFTLKKILGGKERAEILATEYSLVNLGRHRKGNESVGHFIKRRNDNSTSAANSCTMKRRIGSSG